MYHTFSRALKLGSLFWILFILAACSQANLPAKEVAPYYVASVEISKDSNQEAIEASYGGKTILFNPKAGYAILGFDKEAGELSTLSTSLNQNVMSSPEIYASGISAWAGGLSAWAGGLSAWAGGWSAWSSGQSSSAPALPSENTEIFNQIKLAQAHEFSTNYGENIKVAVIDSGIDLNHPLFSGRLAPANEWKDFVDNDSIPQEGSSSGQAYGHGTAVAGIIVQVAPLVTILPLRVLGPEGEGNLDHVLLAIDWAIEKGANVINLSLGTLEYSEALAQSIRHALDYGVYVVAAAGNSGTTNMMHPAASAKLIQNHYALLSVGSVDGKDSRSKFSSYGEALEYVAPGEQLFTAFPDQRVAKATGTSFATPLVAGTLALYMSDADTLSLSLDFNDYIRLGSDFSIFSDGRLNVAGGYSYIPLPNTSIILNTLTSQGFWLRSGGTSPGSSSNPKYTFSVDRAGVISIDLESSIDTYLFLLDSSGQMIAEDDDGGNGYNSRIVKYLARGNYTLVAATYFTNKTGSFSVNVRGFVSQLRLK